MSETRGPVVVFADDHVDTLHMLEQMAHMRGIRPVLARTPREILARVNELCERGECPDAIVADVNYFTGEPLAQHTPRLTGLTAGREVRKKFPDIPIIYVTAYASARVKIQAREQAAEVVEKGPDFDIEALFDRICYMVEEQAQYPYEGPERRRGQRPSHPGRRRTDYVPLAVPEVVERAVESARAKKVG
jgi:CheY-like chemotaxis protein